MEYTMQNTAHRWRGLHCSAMEGQEFAQATDKFYNALAEGDISTATLALFTIEDIVAKQTTKDGVGKSSASSVTYREVWP